MSAVEYFKCQQCGYETGDYTQEDVDDGERILCAECRADPLYQHTSEFEFPTSPMTAEEQRWEAAIFKQRLRR